MSKVVTARNKYGLYLLPESSLYTCTSSYVYNGGVHEQSTIDYLLENHGNGDIIHAGAGFGDFLPALSGISGYVWAFEPNKENYDCCLQTILLNNIKNVDVKNIGLASSKKELKLLVSDGDISLGPRSEISNEVPEGFGYDIVMAYSLDSLVPVDRNVSIIHLDVEGYEFEVLLGAENIIHIHKPVIVLEIHDNPVKYNKFMKSINYKPVRQLIHDCTDMVFINTVYKYDERL